MDLIRRELRKFTTRKVTEDELAENKTFFLGRLPLSLETNEGVAGSIGSLELYDLGLDYLQRYPSLIQAITRDEILEVAREFQSPERYVLAVAHRPEGRDSVVSRKPGTRDPDNAHARVLT